MRLLTEDAIVNCDHKTGIVGLTTSQNFVTIMGRRILIAPNPENRPITGCTNQGPTIKMCTSTLKVRSGYSGFVTIRGIPVVLNNLIGFTDGTPPNAVNYKVARSGQQFVEANT